MIAFKKALIGAAIGTIVTAVCSSAAMASPVFTVNSNSILGNGGTFNATDFTYVSNATVTQVDATHQKETGYAYITGFLNGFNDVTPATIVKPNQEVAGSSYTVYFQFDAMVSGVSGFGGNNVGTVTDFNFSMFADKNADTTFGAGGVLGGSTADDVLLGHGSIKAGSAGFQGTTGAPTFNAVDFFTVDDAAFFTAPVPFYDLVLTSTTTGSRGNVTITGPNTATLNAIAGSANFDVPEPLTLSLFGAGLAGAAALRRRKSKKIA